MQIQQPLTPQFQTTSVQFGQDDNAKPQMRKRDKAKGLLFIAALALFSQACEATLFPINSDLFERSPQTEQPIEECDQPDPLYENADASAVDCE